MNKLKKLLNGFIYALLALILFFQVLGLIGTFLSDVTALKENNWLIPVWIIAVYLIAMAFVLCKAWKKKEKLSVVPMVCAIVGAVLALIVALTLKAALPIISSNVVGHNGTQGLNGWRLFSRHLSLVLVGVVTAVVSGIHHYRLRNARVRKENENYQEHFNFNQDNPLLDESPKKRKQHKGNKA